MIISDLLSSGSKILKSNKIQTHQLDSEIMLCNLLKKKREQVIINLEKKVSKRIVNNFDKLVTCIKGKVLDIIINLDKTLRDTNGFGSTGVS